MRRCGASKLNLVGWSWGTAITATFTVRNNHKIERLALYAPLSAIRGVAAVTGLGAYRTTEREVSRARGIRGIPADRVEEISPRADFDRWFDANLATDPQGASQSPPVLRSPNGVVKDIAEYWGQGQSTYDPAEIKVPTLIVVGEWDQDTPLYMAQDVFARMSHSPDKRMLVLGEGTHAMVLEKHRLRLIDAVQRFLAE